MDANVDAVSLLRGAQVRNLLVGLWERQHHHTSLTLEVIPVWTINDIGTERMQKLGVLKRDLLDGVDFEVVSSQAIQKTENQTLALAVRTSRHLSPTCPKTCSDRSASANTHFHAHAHTHTHTRTHTDTHTHTHTPAHAHTQTCPQAPNSRI